MAAAAIPYILTGISGLAGLFGGRKKQIETSQSSSGTQQTGYSSGNQFLGEQAQRHELSPFQSALAGMFTKGFTDQYNSAGNLNGYKAAGLENLNRTSDIAKKIAQNSLASRGLSYSPVAGSVDTQIDLNRLNQQGDFLNNLPMLQRQLQMQALQGSVGAFSALPTDTFNTQANLNNIWGGSETNTTQQSHGTQTDPGNMMGGLFSGIGAALPWLLMGKMGGGGGGQGANIFGGY